MTTQFMLAVSSMLWRKDAAIFVYEMESGAAFIAVIEQLT